MTDIAAIELAPNFTPGLPLRFHEGNPGAPGCNCGNRVATDFAWLDAGYDLVSNESDEPVEFLLCMGCGKVYTDLRGRDADGLEIDKLGRSVHYVHAWVKYVGVGDHVRTLSGGIFRVLAERFYDTQF